MYCYCKVFIISNFDFVSYSCSFMGFLCVQLFYIILKKGFSILWWLKKS